MGWGPCPLKKDNLEKKALFLRVLSNTFRQPARVQVREYILLAHADRATSWLSINPSSGSLAFPYLNLDTLQLFARRSPSREEPNSEARARARRATLSSRPAGSRTHATSLIIQKTAWVHTRFLHMLTWGLYIQTLTLNFSTCGGDLDEDSPRFPHRGLLIDTARHFLTVPRLKRTITAMRPGKKTRHD